jgi:predicted NAD/FAD-dependent oxidoreductase
LNPVRVVVIGAGVAGLTAAASIADAGHVVVVLDKGRRPGGRLASKNLDGGALADHGAQFFTARSGVFQARVEGWLEEGTVYEWCRGFARPDGHPRYAARGGMRQLGAKLASGLDVRTSVKVATVVPSSGGWSVGWPEGAHGPGGRLDTDVVVLTAPVPQSADLLAGHIAVPNLSYTPTLSLVVALAAAPAIPAPGGIQPEDDPIWSWIADNMAKGVSPVPAATFHAHADVATARWDTATDVLTTELLRAATPWLGGAEVVDVALHRWRFATPATVHPEPCWASPDGRIVLAGDAFGSPRVEGAFLSGLAAAGLVIQRS